MDRNRGCCHLDGISLTVESATLCRSKDPVGLLRLKFLKRYRKRLRIFSRCSERKDIFRSLKFCTLLRIIGAIIGNHVRIDTCQQERNRLVSSAYKLDVNLRVGFSSLQANTESAVNATMKTLNNFLIICLIF